MKNGITSWFIFCSVFSLIGIVCLCFAYFFWNKNRKLKAEGIETTGMVIAHHKKRQIPTTTASAVVVQYMDENNQPKIYYSTTYTTPVLFQIGETIKIWYPKDRPDELLMEGKDEWLMPMIFGGFGLIFSLIGLPALFKELFT